MTAPSVVACLDPGLWRCGLAIFRDRILIHASEPNVPRGADLAPVVCIRANWTIGAPPDLWVVEDMTDYEGGSGRAETLEDLRAVVVRTVGDVRTTYIRPSAWKGQVPKPVHHRRLLAALSPAELQLVSALPRYRDALDAVGLGLFHFGRTARGGVALTHGVPR